MIIISKKTSLKIDKKCSLAVDKACQALKRDLEGILEASIKLSDKEDSYQIRINQKESGEECFEILSDSEANTIEITGAGESGVLSGIYYFIEHSLGVDPFRFWTGFPYHFRKIIELDDIQYKSGFHSPRFRGWFINDEDCLIGWDDSLSITDELWEQIFETMLRAGYNTVIAGTGSSPTDSQLDIASSMGLWIAQHHAEPLGAPMFSDVYPGVTARIPEEKEKFGELYRDSVRISRHRKMIWTLGFRGQGDRAFFEDDPRYDTPRKRGQLIREMIQYQKKIVEEMTSEPQVFIHYLYNESGELYRSGDLTLPDDIIHVYCDNGFGGMRVRREMCGRELDIPAFPLDSDRMKQQGVYYHVSFHDLEISNKLVPLVSPEIITRNLSPFSEAEDFQFFICNVSNIRPHLFQIGLLRKLWDREEGVSLQEGISDYIMRWTEHYFPGHENEVLDILKGYYKAPFSYNSRYDDAKAGEQVYHHGVRRMIRSLIRGEEIRSWFRYLPEDFDNDEDCCRALLKKAEESLGNWRKLCMDADSLENVLSAEKKQFFKENLGMHIRYMRHSCEGFIFALKGVLAFLEKRYRESFTFFYRNRKEILLAVGQLKEGEHGKWKNFYRGDWLTGTKETVRYLETMINYVRIRGEDLWCNSPWIIEALGLDETAISSLPQATASNLNLAEILCLREDNKINEIDLSLLKKGNL